jgi:hypothetical protein
MAMVLLKLVDYALFARIFPKRVQDILQNLLHHFKKLKKRSLEVDRLFSIYIYIYAKFGNKSSETIYCN